MAEISIILPGELAVGPGLGPGHWAELAKLGITAVLSLQEVEEAASPSSNDLGGLLWVRVPVADGHLGGAMGLAQLAAAVEQIRCWRDQGQMVYVHCYAGVGRSPTVCAAYLATVHGLSLGEALQVVRAARRTTSPTAQQLVVLAEFIARLRRDRAGGGAESDGG